MTCAVVSLVALSCSRGGAGQGAETAAPADGAATEGADSANGDRSTQEEDEADDMPWLVPDSPEIMSTVDTSDPRLFMVGDSVMLASGSTVEEMLPSWSTTVDAEVGRGVPTGRSIIASRLPEIGEVAVVVLGHNYSGGGGFEEELERIMLHLDDLERVVWVTVAEWSPDQVEVNEAIRSAHRRHDNVVVADWEALTVENPGYLQADDVHTSSDGTLALADLIARAVGPGPLDVDPKMVRVEVPLAPELPYDYYTTSSTLDSYAAPVPSSWVPVPTTFAPAPPTAPPVTTTLAPTTVAPTTAAPTIPPTSVVPED